MTGSTNHPLCSILPLSPKGKGRDDCFPPRQLPWKEERSETKEISIRHEDKGKKHIIVIFMTVIRHNKKNLSTTYDCKSIKKAAHIVQIITNSLSNR